MDGVVCLMRVRQLDLPRAGAPPVAHTRGPESPALGVTSMNSNGDGGPARTRTWDQGIMSTLILLSRVHEAEEH